MGMERCGSRVKFIPKSAGKCEGMSSHIPKWIPTLRVGVPMDSQIFKKQFEGSKLIVLKIFLYHWNFLKTYIMKMGSHDPFEYLCTSYDQKKGQESKCQFDFRSLKVKNRFELCAYKRHATYP